MDWAIGALPVVAPQIPRVRSNLIDIRLRCIRLSLEFQNENRAVNQKHTVRATRIKREHVLENRAELICRWVCGNSLAGFQLKRGN
jgi:hypothetical protein